MIKHLTLIICILLMSACTNTFVKQSSCTLFSSEKRMPGVYYAIGKGNTELEAIIQARKDIATQLKSKITYQCLDISSSTPEKNKQECTSMVKSEATFIDDKIINKQECGDEVWIQLKYDQRPLAQRIKWMNPHRLQRENTKSSQRQLIPFTYFGTPTSSSPLKVTHDAVAQLWTVQYGNQTFKLTSEALWDQIDWSVCPGKEHLTVHQFHQPTKIIDTNSDAFIQLKPLDSPYFALLFNIYGNNQIAAVSEQSIYVSLDTITLSLSPSVLPNQFQSNEKLIVITHNNQKKIRYFNHLGSDEKLLELFSIRHKTSSFCGLNIKLVNLPSY